MPTPQPICNVHCDYTPPDVDTVNTDSTDIEHKAITVLRDNDTDITFDGTLLGEVASNQFNPGIVRWTVLALYQTRGGAYICEQIGCTDVTGEVERYSAHIASDTDGVLGFFGQGWLAKELYAVLGIKAITHVA